MIYAIGTPINARFCPWKYDWALKPDSIMISAVDLLFSTKLFQKIKKQGLRDFLDWDGHLVCDSGAFSALNRRKKVTLNIENLKEIYQELKDQDSSIMKITLDFPDEKIVENYHKLYRFEVEPVIPYDQPKILQKIIKRGYQINWIFIGRLVPLMRRGGGHSNRLFSVLETFKKHIEGFESLKDSKIWTLGVGAPSLIEKLSKTVEGCDSSRWRITGSNMILLPKGGERGVGNRTKWRGTHHRISEGLEKEVVIEVLTQIDNFSKGIEQLDKSLCEKCYPKQLKGKKEVNLPTIGQILDKLRFNKRELTVYDLELLLRTSGNLRLIFNYWAVLSFNMSLKRS